MNAIEWEKYYNQKVLKNGLKDVFVIKGFDREFLVCDLLYMSGLGSYNIKVDDCKLILRELILTDKEKKQFAYDVFHPDYEENPFWFELEEIEGKIYYYERFCDVNNIDYKLVENQIAAIDWLDARGFQIRNEFERGLAVKAEDNIN